MEDRILRQRLQSLDATNDRRKERPEPAPPTLLLGSSDFGEMPTGPDRIYLASDSEGGVIPAIPVVALNGGGGSGIAVLVAGQWVVENYDPGPPDPCNWKCASSISAPPELVGYYPLIGGVKAITVTNGGNGYTRTPEVGITPASQQATATCTVTSMGAVDILTLVNGGRGYSSTPNVTIRTVNAEVTLTESLAGVITAITLNDGGFGYTADPAVTIIDPSGGSGSGATATARIGGVTRVVIDEPGTGYTIAPTATFSMPPMGGRQAKGHLTIGGGQVTAMVMDDIGAGYIASPSITLAGGDGTGAALEAFASIYSVTEVTLTAGGTGYALGSLAAIATVDPPGSGATATATLTDDVVTSLTLTAPGTGYKFRPDVIIDPPDVSGPARNARAFATLIGDAVTGVTITYSGRHYFIEPDITFGGPGTGATATSTIAIDGITGVLGVPGGGPATGTAITFSNPPSGTTATGNSNSGGVTKIVLTNAGKDYTSAPTVTIAAPGGSGVTATAYANTDIVNGRVLDILITNRGSGYSTTPSVTFSGGGGTGVAATATFSTLPTSIAITDNGTGYFDPYPLPEKFDFTVACGAISLTGQLTLGSSRTPGDSCNWGYSALVDFPRVSKVPMYIDMYHNVSDGWVVEVSFCTQESCNYDILAGPVDCTGGNTFCSFVCMTCPGSPTVYIPNQLAYGPLGVNCGTGSPPGTGFIRSDPLVIAQPTCIARPYSISGSLTTGIAIPGGTPYGSNLEVQWAYLFGGTCPAVIDLTTTSGPPITVTVTITEVIP